MKITYGNKNLSIDSRILYIIGVLFILFMDSMFSELAFGEADPSKTGEDGMLFEKIAIMVFFVLSLVGFNSLNTFLKGWVIAVVVFLTILALESYYTYGTPFIYPHVFRKILVLFMVPFGYLCCNKREHSLYFMAVMICIAFLIQAVTYKREVFSISSFLETQRGFSAGSTYLLTLPTLYFLNKYLFSGKLNFLFLFFALIAIIIFLQHRTVWISILVALLVNFLLVRKSNAKINIGSLAPIVTIPVIAGVLVFSLVISANPELITKFGERVSDIQNYKTEGTGSWRYEQVQSYMPFLQENFLAGMRFRGFELPIQFYHPDADVPYFSDGSGHHFHSLYVDRMFYFGIIGIILLLPLVTYLTRKILGNKKFNVDQLTIASYISTGLLYGISYDWPIYFYGIIGIAIAFINYTDNTASNRSVLPKSNHHSLPVRI